MDKSKIDWQRLAEKELRGKSVEELDWTTLEGIKVKPVYSEEDLNEMFFEAGFKPGPTTPIIARSSKIMSWIKPNENESVESVKKMQE